MNQQPLAALFALLFVSGDEGMSLDQLSFLLEIDRSAVRQQVEELWTSLKESEQSALDMMKIGEMYKLVTKKSYDELIRKYAVSPFMTQLSPAALETLAIIAYKQPITRLGVDEVRGVQSTGPMQKLLLHDLIEEAGRLDSPGRPKLYRTTTYFLDYFGLESLDQLPDASDLFHLPEEESQKLFKDSIENFGIWVDDEEDIEQLELEMNDCAIDESEDFDEDKEK